MAHAVMACVLILGLMPGNSMLSKGSQATLVRSETDSAGMCTMMLKNEPIWRLYLPKLTQFEVGNDGALAGIGITEITYEERRVEAVALIVVAAGGDLVLLEAHELKRDQWPHGNTYPAFGSILLCRDVVAFSVVPASGFLEQLWVYDTQRGGRLNVMDPARLIESRIDPQQTQLLRMTKCYPLPDANLVLVLASSVGQTIEHYNARTLDFGGSVAAVLDLGGKIIWTSELKDSCFFSSDVRIDGNQDSYVIETIVSGSGAKRTSVFSVCKDEEVGWHVEDTTK